ncbi:hypothetical protein SAY87_008185 [Trapa incisa]|uniref:Meiosis-specific protein ASY3-like coiled-coil domain-containing protein n=1 Tax=Trapa incisa TaxID=236973 RepID=A0AAN7KCU0_9MYRT|nr:hypothetical protein SAY87_008185 [Trapa incisa]
MDKCREATTDFMSISAFAPRAIGLAKLFCLVLPEASHQKLLSQAQEAVETQLNDAEKRVAAIQQSAKEQMLQLKLVIAECLEGGILF